MSVAVRGDIGYLSSLVLALTVRDLVTQYRETVFGVLWAILRPTLFMLVFSVVKGIAALPDEGIPYPLFSFTGVSLWLLFVATVSGSTPSITRNAGIIRKMPVPRLVFPVSGALLSLFEYLLALIPLSALFIWYMHGLTVTAFWAIPIVLITALLSFSVGICVASFSVFKEDALKAIPFILQAGLFLSPILYPLSSVPEGYRDLYIWNPMVGPLEGMRAVLLHGTPPDWSLFIPTFVFIGVLLPLGLWAFHKTSKYFADVL